MTDETVMDRWLDEFLLPVSKIIWAVIETDGAYHYLGYHYLGEKEEWICIFCNHVSANEGEIPHDEACPVVTAKKFYDRLDAKHGTKKNKR